MGMHNSFRLSANLSLSSSTWDNIFRITNVKCEFPTKNIFAIGFAFQNIHHQTGSILPYPETIQNSFSILMSSERTIGVAKKVIIRPGLQLSVIEMNRMCRFSLSAGVIGFIDNFLLSTTVNSINSPDFSYRKILHTLDSNGNIHSFESNDVSHFNYPLSFVGGFGYKINYRNYVIIPSLTHKTRTGGTHINDIILQTTGFGIGLIGKSAAFGYKYNSHSFKRSSHNVRLTLMKKHFDYFLTLEVADYPREVNAGIDDILYRWSIGLAFHPFLEGGKVSIWRKALFLF